MLASARSRRWTAFAACGLIGAGVFWAPDPDTSLRSAMALHDFGHVVAFGVVTGLLLFATRARSYPTFRRRAAAAGLAVVLAVAIGAAVELAQELIGDGGELGDVLRDAGGALFVAAAWAARDTGLSARGRSALAVAGIVILAPFTFPTVMALSDEALGRAQFPVLASFESDTELSRFELGSNMHPRLMSAPNGQGGRVSALQLELPPGKYPGFVLSYFPRDWRGMRALRLLLVNPEPTPLEVTVRIDDAEYDYRLDIADRYNRSFVLSPGANSIEIPLIDVATAPRGRRFDLGRVQAVLVYAVDLGQPREIIVGPIALTP